MLELLDRQQGLTGNQRRIVFAAILGDMLKCDAPLEEGVIYDKQPIDRCDGDVRPWAGVRPSCMGRS